MVFVVSKEQRQALVQSNIGGSQMADDAFGADLLSQIRTQYERQGYCHVRGLLDESLLTDLEAQAEEVVVDQLNEEPGKAKGGRSRNFTSSKFGEVFSSKDKSKIARQCFREVALHSAVASFIAQILLQLADGEKTDTTSSSSSREAATATSTTTLRVLKDAFLAKGVEEKFCGWHVDDLGFWPTVAVDPSPGVNAWICLDEIPSSYGGGMAVSPGSHRADEWRFDAYRLIGSTQLYPPGGFRDVSELIEKVENPFRTCTMLEAGQDGAGAEMYARLEATKILPDYEAGDVLFCNRWLFHRSILPTEAGVEHLQQKTAGAAVFKRYTIRYEVGTARLMQGFTMEPSVVLDPSNGGKTLDEVCASISSSEVGATGASSSCWYPQCWPALGDEAKEQQEKALDRLAKEVIPVVENRLAELFKEVGPYLPRKK